MKQFVELLRLVNTQRWRYCVALTALIAGTVTILMIPPLFGRVVNSFQALANGKDAPAARHAILSIAGLITFDALATLAYTFLVALASERITNELRARFFRNLVSQPLDERPPKLLGQIASEFACDLGLVQDGFSSTLVNFLRFSLFTIGAFCALLYIDLRLTAIALVGVAIFAGLILIFIQQANKAIVSIQQYRGKIMGLLLEGAANVYIVQAYARTAYLARRFDTWLDETFKRVRSFLLLSACISPLSLMFFSLVMLAVAFYGMQELRNDDITVEQLVAYFSYAVVLVMSASQAGYLGGRVRQAVLMLEKHQAMLAMPNEASEAMKTGANTAAPMRLGEPCGVEIRNVTFTYPGREAPALSDISLTIPAGRVSAVIGESGAGKTTLAALLCGLYRTQSGSVHAVAHDRTPLAVPLSALHQQIALVPQEPFLFAASISENITFGRDGISEAQVRQAAIATRIHDFIMTLPEGYRTVIEEGGKNLSRGQRQRLSIARALVGNPAMMILDEATASLDVISERAIKTLVDDLRGRVTFVIIAHQGALLSDADHLIALQSGEVVFEGRPEEGELDRRAPALAPALQVLAANSVC